MTVCTTTLGFWGWNQGSRDAGTLPSSPGHYWRSLQGTPWDSGLASTPNLVWVESWQSSASKAVSQNYLFLRPLCWLILSSLPQRLPRGVRVAARDCWESERSPPLCLSPGALADGASLRPHYSLADSIMLAQKRGCLCSGSSSGPLSLYTCTQGGVLTLL